MLSENAIENLVNPIVNRQEAINTYVIGKIAKDVRAIGKLTPTNINQMKLLVDYGANIREMNKELAKLSNLQVRDIKALIKTVAIDSHIDAKPLYDYRHKSFIPYKKNTKLQQFVRVIGNRTAGTFENISNSKATGFLIRDLKHPKRLKFQSIDDTYKSVIDEAIQSVVAGGVDYRTAMRRTMKQLTDSGIRRLSWDSGYTQRLDTAVRRNILEGIRAIQQAVEDEHGKEIGADGKELSAHINSAADHEPFQGHQFQNEEFEKLQNNEDFEDIKGKKFAGVSRVIGQFNCRHIARSIIIGVSKPRYTEEQLNKFIEDNHKGYTLPNGKHLTMYECTQLQRQLETKIRYAKEEQMMHQTLGDKESAKIARQKVVQLIKEYKQFSAACNLKIKKDRISVYNYTPLKS